jgi:hypothetical protein
MTTENTPSRKQHEAGFVCCLLHSGFLLGLFFNPENGGDMLLQNAG